MPNTLAWAIRFANLAHHGQRRKYVDEPYINHPVRVMQAVCCDGYYGGDEKIAMAAVMHDVQEDTPYSLDNGWYSDVVNWVDELTNVYTHEAFPGMNRAARKAKEFERLAGISPQAKAIKLYDRLDNLQSWFVPGTVLTDEMVGFGRVFARESLELCKAVVEPNFDALGQSVNELAARLKFVCGD